MVEAGLKLSVLSDLPVVVPHLQTTNPVLGMVALIESNPTKVGPDDKLPVFAPKVLRLIPNYDAPSPNTGWCAETTEMKGFATKRLKHIIGTLLLT